MLNNHHSPAHWLIARRLLTSKIRALLLGRMLLASLTCLTISVVASAQQGPDLLTYGELVQLYEQKVPSEVLQTRLQRILTTPFVTNAASSRVATPLVPSTPGLGRFVRI